MPWVWLEYYEHVFKGLSQFFENIWLGLRIWIADIPIWALNSQGRLICSICAHPSIPTRGASSWQGTRAAGGDWQLGHQLVYESRNKIKNIIIDWCFGMMLNNANLKTTIHLKKNFLTLIFSQIPATERINLIFKKFSLKSFWQGWWWPLVDQIPAA